MATKNLPMELHEITTESEGSDTDSDWDDSEEDPDFDLLEETHSKFSILSLKHKAKARVVEDNGLGEEVNASAHDGEKFETVQKLIQVELLEKLKVDECKLYLRKNGLRLTGNKDTLIQRIKEHLEIYGGEEKYPPSSFVLNCKGDACTGDVVLFEQNVYELFNLAPSGSPCGKRIVAGRIVKESYGAAKQQHTFTKWEDEAKRQKILMEKHSRGSLAREDREARMQEKGKRKKIKENRVSKKDSARNQSQSNSHITRPQYQPQETNVPINPEKPEFPSRNSGLFANIRKETSSIVNKPAAVTGHHVDSKTLGRTSFTAHNMHNQQAWSTGDYKNISDIGHMRRGADHSAYYNYADSHFREKPTTIQKYHHHDYRNISDIIGHMRRGADHSAYYNYADSHFREKPTIIQKYHQDHHHRMPLANANHSQQVLPNRESYDKQKQACRDYARGRCYCGDNRKFLHDLRTKGMCELKKKKLLCKSRYFPLSSFSLIVQSYLFSILTTPHL